MSLKRTALLLTLTCFAFPVAAGLPEAVQAFNTADYANAYAEFTALAQEGSATAAYYLGRMYQEGLGVSQDTAQAIHYFEQADRGYNTDASVRLAQMAIKGEGLAQNTPLGIEYLKKAAYAGSANALYELGQLYEQGTGVDKDYRYAYGFYYMDALKGDKRGQLKVAQYSLAGRGTPQDFDAAIKWYTRSANQGYIPAQQEWANLRASNQRLLAPLDAYSWYSILAAYDSGDVGKEAAGRRDALGSRFQSDIITAQQRKIMNWRPTSPENSVPLAERQKAVMPTIPGFNDEKTISSRLEVGNSLHSDASFYGLDQGLVENTVQTNNRTALEDQVSQIASAGQIGVYGYYGDVLRNRLNDSAAANDWYRRGAEAGDVYAQYQLGKSYCEGRGIDPDIGTCYGWLLTAADNPRKHFALTVQNALDTVQTTATAEELDAGKKQAAERHLSTDQKTNEEPQKRGLFNLL